MGRLLVAAPALAVPVASGTGWWVVGRADESIAGRSVDALVPDDPSIRSVTAGGGASAGGAAAAENILILGLDTRPADEVAPGEGTSQSDVLRIDRLIVLEFDGFSSIVDAMGGLTLTFDDPVVDRGRTIIDHAGTQVITGEQALALVRARHVAPTVPDSGTDGLRAAGTMSSYLDALLTDQPLPSADS